MTPIGKGSRFSVLTGDRRGQVLTVNRILQGCAGFMANVDGDSADIGIPAESLAGSNYQRLPDAPAPPDALLAELSTAAHALGDRGRDGPQATMDDIRWAVEVTPGGVGYLRESRAALVEAAALAIAGIREIDRRTT